MAGIIAYSLLACGNSFRKMTAVMSSGLSWFGFDSCNFLTESLHQKLEMWCELTGHYGGSSQDISASATSILTTLIFNLSSSEQLVEDSNSETVQCIIRLCCKTSRQISTTKQKTNDDSD